MTTVARRQSAQDIHDTTAAPQGERGFTLIELSIVLVIIGLLIGGVLQGQEMINNTRLKTTVAQTDAITAAVQTFQDKFGQMPGDFSSAAVIGSANNGNANGVIDGTGTAANSLALGTAVTDPSESTRVFEHLNLANLIQGINQNNQFLTKVEGGLFEVATYNFTAVPDGVGVRMRATSGTTASLYPPQDAFSLDIKYDDGIPNTGRWESVGTNCVTTTGTAPNIVVTWGTLATAECMTIVSIR